MRRPSENAEIASEAGGDSGFQIGWLSNTLNSNKLGYKTLSTTFLNPFVYGRPSEVLGGDKLACLSSTEVNSLLLECKRTGDGMIADGADVDSALFYRLRLGLVEPSFAQRTIANALLGSPRRTIAFVGHFRHHWIALRFRAPDRHQHMILEVFDSAPSPIVQRDLRKLAASLRWPAPTFIDGPRQARGSDECGLFALAAVLLSYVVPDQQLPTGTFDLQPLRDVLLDEKHPRVPRFLEVVRNIYGIGQPSMPIFDIDACFDSADNHVCPGCHLSVHITNPAQRSNIIRNHLLSNVHRRNVPRAAATVTSFCGKLPNGGSDQCTASKQSKHGGTQCSSPAVALGLCRMHLLLSRRSSVPCGATSKAGRLCSHMATHGLHHCAFHVSDVDFNSWVHQIRSHPDVVPVLALAAPPLPQAAPMAPAPDASALVEALAHAHDPDFENELAALMLPWTFEPLPLPSASSTLPLGATYGRLRSHVQQRGHASHPLAALAWKRPTLLGHARSLRSFFGTDPTSDAALNARLLTMPMIPALLEIINTRRRKRGWRWTSTLRTMAELAGALRYLPVSQGIASVTLSDHVDWLAAIRGVAGKAKSERPRVPKAATAVQVLGAIRAEPRREVRLLLAATWLCTGRTGDCRLLSPEDTALHDEQFTVTFRDGKTISRRGPFSLHTEFPAGWRQELGIADGDVSWVGLLKKASVHDVLLALRRIDPTLENRSIRRGALQTLALSGTPEDVLLLFSGHTSFATLRRYLGWGAIGSEKKSTMTSAAKALAPRESPPAAVIGGAPTPLGCENERWLQFLGVEAPPLSALPSTVPIGDPNQLPMMSKDVAGAIDIGIVLKLLNAPHALGMEFQHWAAAIPAELRQFSESSLGWLHDRRLYEKLDEYQPAVKVRTRKHACCRLPVHDFEIQQKLRKYELEEEALNSPIQAWLRIFAVPEWHKEPPRRRHIAEPLLNDRFCATPTVKFRSRQQRHDIISGFPGGYATTLDLASFFDQIPLHPDVRQFFGIRFGKKRSRMKVLPMGFRPSAQLAQVITWLLCTGLEIAGVRIITYVDNILILAPTAQEAERVRKIIRGRAKLIGAIFNPDEEGPSRRFEFLGEAFDLTGEAVSVSVSRKTIKKLNLLDEDKLFEAAMTKRQLAAVVGLALFASGSGLARNDIFLHFHALRFYREQLSFSNGRMISLWDDPISPAPTQVRQCFTEWLSQLKRNVPRQITPSTPDDDSHADILFTDACETGWGAIHCRPDGSIRVIAQQWSPEDHEAWDLSSAVSSEPLAVANAMLRCITPALSKRVIAYTDHLPIVYAVEADCARAYAYWRLQQTLRRIPVPCSVRFVPGSANPADSFSRGGDLSHDSWTHVLCEALEYHRSTQGHLEKAEDGEHGVSQPEWLATARNPSRALVASCHGTAPI